MATEIKIQYDEIEKALAAMQASIQAFHTDFPSGVGEGNEMDAMKKLNELNEACQKAMETYKELLIMNTDATKQSVDQMKKADKNLSAAISGER
ncbi:YwqI/YxiC family protein [Metabacillus sp. KIGAM252]|uniref:YwqI/YxiC family protein n=1 Tax=Metabacillus flavus TaxID=2823519 RepID=A0ABS5LIV2_9BACI|nr:YwqI/YxiC family protein [Metabacillus flavus]MBS2970662.1 YwqI/YxiC family protein [Metabacillus flavus]